MIKARGGATYCCNNKNKIKNKCCFLAILFEVAFAPSDINLHRTAQVRECDRHSPLNLLVITPTGKMATADRRCCWCFIGRNFRC